MTGKSSARMKIFRSIRLDERLGVLSWSGVENFSRQILALLFFFVIVRFLQPSDLGVFSLSVAMNSVLGIIIDEPIGEALVQKADVSKADWNTGFTVNLLIALACLGVSILVSGGLAYLLNEPRLAHAVPVLSVAAVVGALGNIHRAYLSRLLRFRSIAQFTLLAQVTGGLSGVGLAVLGFGYWAQIANLFIAATVTTIAFWAVTPWRPSLRLDRSTIRSCRAYVASFVVIRSIYQLRDQFPLVIVGLLSGTAEVGFLSLALRVGRSVGQLFEDLTSRPVLSLLSREQHEIRGFGSVLLQILTVIGLLAIPAFAGLAEIGERLITFVFGSVWTPAGAMLPWVCGVLAGWLLLHIVIVSLRARGLGRIAIYITTPATLLDVMVLALLAPISARWALMGWAARALLSIPVALRMLHAHLGIAPLTLLQRWAGMAVATALMILVMRYLGATDLFGAGQGRIRDLTSLGVIIGAGALAYGLVVLAFMPTLQRRLWRVRSV